MKPPSKKRSSKAIELLLVSSAFLLEGCRPRKEEAPAQSEVLPGVQSEQTTAEQQAQTQPQTVTGSRTGSSWGYNPFFWGYGSGYGRSWSSSSSSNRSNSGFFSGSGPASHFGAQNSLQTPASRPASSNMPTVHTHTGPSHAASSHSVSHGGFGSHASSASS